MDTLTVHTTVLQQVLLSVRVLYQYYSCYQYAVYYYFTPTRYVFSSVATAITLVVQFSGSMHKLFISNLENLGTCQVFCFQCHSSSKISCSLISQYIISFFRQEISVWQQNMLFFSDSICVAIKGGNNSLGEFYYYEAFFNQVDKRRWVGQGIANGQFCIFQRLQFSKYDVPTGRIRQF